jgi:hypothetical protein
MTRRDGYLHLDVGRAQITVRVRPTRIDKHPARPAERVAICALTPDQGRSLNVIGRLAQRARPADYLRFAPSGICVALSTDQFGAASLPPCDRPFARRRASGTCGVFAARADTTDRNLGDVPRSSTTPRMITSPSSCTTTRGSGARDSRLDGAAPGFGHPLSRLRRHCHCPVAGGSAALGVVGLAEPPIRVLPRWAWVVPGHEHGDMSSPICDEVSP